MRYLLDSNAANDYIHQKHGVFERAIREVAYGHRIGIGIPVLAELIAGIELSQSRDKNLNQLELAMEHLRLWPFAEAAAYVYGKLHADLQLKGKPIGTIDVMIAATALVMRPCKVVTTDQDFGVIPGLEVVNWRV
ncbi:MAG: type II toxin-antitoxin system VapC family toxin [Gemmatales bacterium]